MAVDEGGWVDVASPVGSRTTIEQPAEAAGGCQMSDSLYVKANGEFPCWDDAGEQVILRVLDEEALRAGAGDPLFNSAPLAAIRSAFLEGRDPHPGVCSGCAVRGHGVTTALELDAIRVLHVEPCFLCQLACPLCIAPKDRVGMKSPPYYMSASYFDALLTRLRDEGITRIDVVHFEGRGDPLLNRSLGAMVERTKELFPYTFTQVTTHGNYPFKPWMLESGLDLLRLSVDGAFPESYARYRVGGRLAKVLALMRDIRDARTTTPSNLRVQWKYILFEWNDSDEEMRHAVELASELGVEMHFCLTHSPGRSTRFESVDDLQGALGSIAPEASATMTFPLKVAGRDFDVVAEHVERRLLASLRAYRAGDDAAGTEALIEAMALELGIDRSRLDGVHDLATVYLDRVLASPRSPATLSALGNIHQVVGDLVGASRLFRRYLELAVGAADRDVVAGALARLDEQIARPVEQGLLASLRAYRAGDDAAGREALIEAMALELNIDRSLLDGVHDLATVYLDRVLASPCSPATLSALANIHIVLRDAGGASVLFDRYLALVPDAPERASIEKTLATLQSRRWRTRARRQASRHTSPRS